VGDAVTLFDNSRRCPDCDTPYGYTARAVRRRLLREFVLVGLAGGGAGVLLGMLAAGLRRVTC